MCLKSANGENLSKSFSLSEIDIKATPCYNYIGDKMIGIYKITNKVNGKAYIGQSINIERRFREHKYISSETNQSLVRAYKKYGRENFEFEVLEECTLDNLNEREIFYINTLKPQYNRTSGGDGSPKHIISEETRKILSKKAKEQWERLPEEDKQRIIKHNLKKPKIGHLVSKETREKLRQHNLGKKQSKETIEKRKQTFIEKRKNGYVQNNEKHKKKVICIETGEIFNSLKEAGIKYNLTTLCGHLKGKYKTCKGKHYKYYQENCSVTTNDDECNRVG